MMRRINWVFLSVWLSVSVLFLFRGQVTFAELTVQITTIPPIQKTIELEHGPKRIALTAQASQQQHVKYAWTLQGPGELRGDPCNPGIIYVPPTSLEQPSVTVIVSVSVSDNTGATSVAEVTFTLLGKEPTPTPKPSPRPTKIPIVKPTPTATPAPTVTPAPILTPTPTRPPKTLEEITQSLPVNLQTYQDLVAREKEGQAVNGLIVEALEAILWDLNEMERILQITYTQPDLTEEARVAVLKRIQSTQANRTMFEDDLAQRQAQ